MTYSFPESSTETVSTETALTPSSSAPVSTTCLEQPTYGGGYTYICYTIPAASPTPTYSTGDTSAVTSSIATSLTSGFSTSGYLTSSSDELSSTSSQPAPVPLSSIYTTGSTDATTATISSKGSSETFPTISSAPGYPTSLPLPSTSTVLVTPLPPSSTGSTDATTATSSLPLSTCISGGYGGGKICFPIGSMEPGVTIVPDGTSSADAVTAPSSVPTTLITHPQSTSTVTGYPTGKPDKYESDETIRESEDEDNWTWWGGRKTRGRQGKGVERLRRSWRMI
ncbi:hypothetical protein GL218_02651 [Daldinia childiae]|uniref:uncharacterized protein n=1 Tax=Daldinia childiae TaxID=326645 RepID=UPI0014456DD1|nr:uncharacterized protein GL218_02651 [Daldinia childiae]KAF3064733.1 hypothetical protein GL218_02651 [Daldinia childiae]